MTDTLEKKLSRFSKLISNFNNDILINFWNEIINDIEFEQTDEDLMEFQNYLLLEKNAKLQTYIAMSNRLNSEFVGKFNIIDIFERTPQYNDYLRKALNYEFRNKKPKKHKRRTIDERKKRLIAFREKIGLGNFGFIEEALS